MSNAMFELSVLLSLSDHLSGQLGGVQSKLTAMGARLTALGQATSTLGQSMMGAMGGPIAAFAEAEDAATSLKTAMMDSSGKVTADFARINDLATDLGNKLPGTTADFQQMMTKLKEMGVSNQAILGGLGKAAAYLGVELKMPFAEAAEFAARLSNATGVAEKDMMTFLDTIARTKNLGVSASEMGYAFSRSSGALMSMGLQGLKSSQDLAPLYAMLINMGMSGETVGTGFASIMNALNVYSAGSTKAARNVQKELAGMGIQLKFLDEHGHLLGVEQMIGQLEKLKALNPEKQAGVIRSLFGTGQDAQMVTAMLTKGVAGYEELRGRMQQQANLNTKVNAQLGTLKNLWDAATGTLTNTKAALAGALAPELKRAVEWFGKLSEQLGKWIGEHPKLTKWIAGFMMFGGAALTLVGTLGSVSGVAMMAFGQIGKLSGGIASAITYTSRWVQWNLAASGGLRGLASSGWSAITGGLAALRTGFLAAASGAWSFSVALLANPLTWIVVGIVAAAALIYKYWGPISGFFRGMFDGIKEALQPLAPAFHAVWDPLVDMISPAIDAIGRFFSWIGRLLKPVDDVGGHAESMGKRVGLAIGNVIKWILDIPTKLVGLGQSILNGLAALPGQLLQLGKRLITSLANGIVSMAGSVISAAARIGGSFLRWYISLPGKMLTIGRNLIASLARGIAGMAGSVISAAARIGSSIINGIKTLPGKMMAMGGEIINGLIRGITGKIGKLKERVTNLGSNVKGWFARQMGINSPSTVFAALGGNLGEGLAQGMDASKRLVNRAAGALAMAAVVAPAASAMAMPAIQPLTQTVRQALQPMAMPAIPALLQTIRQAVLPAATRAMPQLTQIIRQIIQPANMPAPQPLTQAVNPVLAAAMPPLHATQNQAVAPVTQATQRLAPVLQPMTMATAPAGPGQQAMPRAPARAATGPAQPQGQMTVTFAPAITIQGGQDAPGQIQQAMQLSFVEFERLMRRYDAERKRTAPQGGLS